MGPFNQSATKPPGPKARLQSVMILVLGLMLFGPVGATQSSDKVGYCQPLFSHLDPLFPAQHIELPVDHFHNDSRFEPHSDKYFKNRWWFNDTYYRPGGPIIIQNAGEITGKWHLNDMLIGLQHELAKATNGIAVVLEHRYYGHSYPVWPLESTEDFRFLQIEQAMADQAYFAQHVVFPGKEHLNLTAPNTPWFAIGCSYPGALTAFERIQYPDLFWAAISSSGTTAPKTNEWEYWNVVREYSPHECVANFGKLMSIYDNILIGGNTTQIGQLRQFFKVPSSVSHVEFAVQLQFRYGLQSASWLPCLNAEANPVFCRELSASKVLFPKAENFTSMAKTIIEDGGWGNETESLTVPLLNHLGWFEYWPRGNSKRSIGDDAEGYSGKLQWLSYQYQICTQLGGFLTGAEEPTNSLPVISRLITLEYAMKDCKTELNLTGMPDYSIYEKYGQHNLSYPRLMLVGGEADPWRPETPLATRDTPTRLNYSSTSDQPWVVIPGGTHCSDWPGVFESQEKPGIPPDSIKYVHDQEKAAFQRWLKEWHDAHPNYNVYAQS